MSVNRKWHFQAQRIEGDPPIIYLWVGEWAFIAFGAAAPIYFELIGTGAWIVDPVNARRALQGVIMRFSASRFGGHRRIAAKRTTEEKLQEIISNAMDGIAGQVVQRFPGSEPGQEIVTVIRSTELPE